MNAPAFPDRLATRLADSLPGHDAHRRMAPRLSPRREALSIDGRACREAGVLVLLMPHDGAWAVVLTVRRDDLDDHAGQISFPGGKREDGESLRDTALREAHEEIGLVPSSVRVLGALTPLYVPPSNFCVHPFVGVAASDPDLRPTDREVTTILHAPLSRLLEPAARSVETWTLRGKAVDVPVYHVDGRAVWGATAMMLAEFLAVVRDMVPHGNQ